MDLNKPSGTNERTIRDELRLLGGLLFAFSVCVTFFRFAWISDVINGNGETANEGVGLANLIGWLCTISIGLAGSMVGFLIFIQGKINSKVLVGFLLLEQTAWIPFISEIVDYGLQAATGVWPPPMQQIYEPSPAEVRLGGAMNSLAHIAGCFFVYGSVSFLAIEIYHKQNGEGQRYNAGYYRQRLIFYSFMTFLFGFVVLLSGSYTIANWGNGPLPAPIPFGGVIYFPEFAVVAGILNLGNTAFALARGFRWLVPDSAKDDIKFQQSMMFQYLFEIVVLILANMAYAPGSLFAGDLPSYSLTLVPSHFFPAYLEYKARNTPETIEEDYYYAPIVPTDKPVQKDVEEANSEEEQA